MVVGDEKCCKVGKWNEAYLKSWTPRVWRLGSICCIRLEFNRIYVMVEPLYCADNGRPSVNPVVLFKMVLIRHLY